jgi:hypothetical protein
MVAVNQMGLLSPKNACVTGKMKILCYFILSGLNLNSHLCLYWTAQMWMLSFGTDSATLLKTRL